MNTQRLLDRFCRFVRCDSESREERAFCEMVEAELKALGLETKRDEQAAVRCGSDGFNVYGYLPGEGEPILFCAHMDTVQPGKGVRPVVADGVITAAGDTILGADDKCGIAAVLEAIECVVEEKRTARPVEVYFTVCEEIGLYGSLYGDFSMVKSRQAVVLDGGAPGAVVNQSPTRYEMQVRVKGRPAHAAVSPEKGVHALKAAAEMVSVIELGRLDEQSVRNISNFLAPGATNVVAERASFEVEVRSLRDELAEQHVQEVRDVAKRVAARYGADVEIDCHKEFDALHVPADSPLVRTLCDGMRALGREPSIRATMGGSDTVNLHARGGLEAVNIGTGMQNAHGLDERIEVADLEWLAKLVHWLIAG